MKKLLQFSLPADTRFVFQHNLDSPNRECSREGEVEKCFSEVSAQLADCFSEGSGDGAYSNSVERVRDVLSNEGVRSEDIERYLELMSASYELSEEENGFLDDMHAILTGATEAAAGIVSEE